MTYARRVDSSQLAISRALQAIGASVIDTHTLADYGDLTVGYRGQTVILECKSREHRGEHKRHLAQQAEQRARWQGGPWVVVETPEEALRAIRFEVPP